jgi:hypothetical protein
MAYSNTSLSHHGIKGQRWGVRRFRNADGTLTEAGKRRYDRDVRENLSKKKENRIDTSEPNPSRWVKEDIERTKRTVDAGTAMVRQLKDIERSTAPKSKTRRMDLSEMTDKELRERINRELLEKRYNDLFNKEEVSKGRETVRDILEVDGAVLAIGSSALGIAPAIKELHG